MKYLTNLLIKGAMTFALALCAAKSEAQQVVLASEQSSMTAIDILLEPGATMLQHCDANNARLLKVYPQGFAKKRETDKTHRNLTL